MIALIASASAALHAIDQVVVVAGDIAERRGEQLPATLTLYRDANPLVAVDLSPLRAMSIARELIDAAGRRLEGATEPVDARNAPGGPR